MTQAFGGASVGKGTPFVALAGSEGLRWVLPAGPGAASRVLAGWQPYRPMSRFAWKGIQLAARTGMLGVIPGAHSFCLDLTHVAWADFGWPHAEPPRIVTHVGTVGPTQKLVCNFLHPTTGEPIFVVKLPVMETAKPCLSREFATLTALAERKLHLGPAPVRLDDQVRFSVQSFVDGSPDGFELSPAHVSFLAALIQPGRRIALESLRDDLRAHRQTLAAAGTLRGAPLAKVDSLLNDGAWGAHAPAVRAHGDFAPWNLKRCPDGSIRAVDWEDSVAEELPYVDLHHFRLSLIERLNRSCTVPWNDYTAALMRADPAFTQKDADATLAVSEIAFWLRGRFANRPIKGATG